MARLKGIDNLNDLTGKLTAGFNGVTLKRLETEYKASAPEASKVLTDFFLAAATLQRRESEFNQRAKPKSPDLKANLRSREQLAAVKNFETAKQSLLSVNPEVGGEIVKVVERNLTSSTKPGAKPAAKRSFAAASPAAL
jgi:hypothetical protein